MELTDDLTKALESGAEPCPHGVRIHRSRPPMASEVRWRLFAGGGYAAIEFAQHEPWTMDMGPACGAERRYCPMCRAALAADKERMAEALPAEQARCRELLKQHREIDLAGAFGGATIRHELRFADEAMASGDVFAMKGSYEVLKTCKRKRRRADGTD